MSLGNIAIINTVIDYGSTGDLTRNLYEYGKTNNLNVFVYYGRGKKYNDNHIIKIDSILEIYFHKLLTLITGLQGYFSNFATQKLVFSLKRNNINSIILLNLHGYYLNEKTLFNYIKKNNISVVYITPDEYAGMGKCCYSNECKKYNTECEKCPNIKDYPKSLIFDQSKRIFNRKVKMYDGLNKITFAGPEYNLNKFKQSKLLRGKKMMEVNWGIDINYTYTYKVDESIYVKYKIPKNKIIILTVGKFSDDRKGVKKYFFDLANSIENDSYHFINIGYDGNSDIPNNMTVIPYMKDQIELSKIYSISDLYVLASFADTMPLTCLISLACGTPICCFYTSGLKYLAPKDSGIAHYAMEISTDSLKQIVLNKRKKTNKEILDCIRYAKDEYSIQSFNKKIYDEIVRWNRHE